MTSRFNLTVKGQVTIPKDVRDALGLKAGEPVEFDWKGGDEAVIRKGGRSAVADEKRYDAVLARIAEARAAYSALPSGGQTTNDYMATIREPVPDPRTT